MELQCYSRDEKITYKIGDRGWRQVAATFQSVLQFAATMRQRESWRKVRRDNAIRAEKKVESFSSAIKRGFNRFSVPTRYRRVTLRQKTMLRNAKKERQQKKRNNYCISQS